MDLLSSVLETIGIEDLGDKEVLDVVADGFCGLDQEFHQEILLELYKHRPRLGNAMEMQLKILHTMETYINDLRVSDADIKRFYVEMASHLIPQFRMEVFSKIEAARSKVAEELRMEYAFVKELAVSARLAAKAV